MPTSTPEEHEMILTRWFEELWNKQHYDVAQMLTHPDYVKHGDKKDVKQGPDGIVETVKTWHRAFPDGRMTIEDITTEDDRSVIRTTFRGTHTGPFGDIPASGKQVSVTSIGIERIVDGKLIESWGDLNILGLMQQIGTIPLPQ